MNRFVLHIAIILLSVFPLKAQNLIYNGGFEEYYSCPISNDLHNDQLELAKGWWKPTLGTSDYFNRCNNFEVNVPNNFWGYQEALGGDAYVGICPSVWTSNNEYLDFEYIQTKLIKPLKPCFEYKFTMYISLANKSTHATGRIGALFTSNSINNNSISAIDSFPTVYNQSQVVIDSVNWLKIEGDFIANGFEQYVTIGYFFSTVTDDTLFVQDYLLGTFGSYYYIDNVSLYEIGEVSKDLCTANGFIVPNVLTVNNDGVNDFINISSLSDYDFEMKIFNRWGNIVTVLNKNNSMWNGGDCNDGVYYYQLNFPADTGLKQQNGFIHLVR